MSRQYYYLIAGLPDIFFDDKKVPFTLVDFRNYLSEYLTDSEIGLLYTYFWRFDNENILNRLNDSSYSIDLKGNLDEQTIDELFSLIKEGSINDAEKIAPAYLCTFIDAFKNEKAIYEGKSWDLQLSELYYQFCTKTPNDFINKWFSFERDLNNLLTAIRCRNNNLEIASQIIGSGDLNEKLIKSSAKDFGLSDEIENLEKIFKAVEEDDILISERKIDQIKWDKLDDDSFFYYFNLEKLFVFIIKLSIAERWLSLDKETGIKLFEELLKSLEASYEFPEEFSLK